MSSLKSIARKIRIEQSYASGQYTVAPEFLSLVITFRCFFRCQSCSIWKKTEFPQMTDEEWLRSVDDIQQHLPSSTFVEINGGEPLIRRDLVFAMVRKLKQRFHEVALNSNGLLIDDEVVRKLELAGLDLMKISFYSLNSDVHNTLRGNTQAYRKARAAIERLSKSTIKPEVGILLTKENMRDVPALIEYLQKLPNVSIILQPLDERVESTESKDAAANHLLTTLWPDRAAVLETFRWIKAHPAAIKNSAANIEAIERYYLNPPDVLRYRCFAGQRSLVVYPNGNVALCFKGNNIGNIQRNRIADILRSPRAQEERNKIRTCPKYCRIIGCNFSRGFREYMADALKKPA